MKTSARMALLAVILLLGGVLGLSCSGVSEMATGDESADTPSDEPPPCLFCHGPYEDLMAMAPSITTKDGTTVNPHKYVPHDSESIPECAYCHQAHPIPPEEAVKKPRDISYCFACHHLQVLTRCNTCHEEM